jgi:hypothetical protein
MKKIVIIIFSIFAYSNISFASEKYTAIQYTAIPRSQPRSQLVPCGYVQHLKNSQPINNNTPFISEAALQQWVTDKEREIANNKKIHKQQLEQYEIRYTRSFKHNIAYKQMLIMHRNQYSPTIKTLTYKKPLLLEYKK